MARSLQSHGYYTRFRPSGRDSTKDRHLFRSARCIVIGIHLRPAVFRPKPSGFNLIWRVAQDLLLRPLQGSTRRRDRRGVRRQGLGVAAGRRACDAGRTARSDDIALATLAPRAEALPDLRAGLRCGILPGCLSLRWACPAGSARPVGELDVEPVPVRDFGTARRAGVVRAGYRQAKAGCALILEQPLPIAAHNLRSSRQLAAGPGLAVCGSTDGIVETRFPARQLHG